MEHATLRNCIASFYSASFAVCLVTCALLVTATVSAKPIPQNLGNGLDKLVESNLILKGRLPAPTQSAVEQGKTPGTAQGASLGVYNGHATPQAAHYAAAAISEPITKRFLVDILLSGKVSVEELKRSLINKIPSLRIVATDKKYRRAGVIEAYVSLDDVPALAQTPGVRSVHLGLKPQTRRPRKVQPARITAPSAALTQLGTTFDQGVTQHRVDKINQYYNPSAPVNYTGAGTSIGFLSDSFNTSGDGSAQIDVNNNDLPGKAGNPLGNTQSVVVLAEGPTDSTDEGRAMVQIGYKMAPKARLAFATAFGGEVDFANNIRALAALPGFTKSAQFQQGFKADVICDDVSYFDEPFFQNGIIGDGVDDVAAAGVSYFSSAANDIGINGYDSDLRIVPNGTGLTAATNTALAHTNINLASVPTELYAGGFHNFDSSGDPNKQDVAQTVNVPSLAVLAQFLLTDFFVIMQWDDPYDASDPVLGPLIYHNTGNIDGLATMSVTYDNTSTPPLPPFTAGTEYVITEKATSGDFDGIISIIDPNGTTVLTQDTGTDEVVVFFPSISGQYKIKVDRFASTTGSFTIDVNTANGVAGVSTDLNLLVFDTATGAYLSSKSLTSNNIASNRPIELGSIMGDNSSSVQFVIARGNTPTNPNPATHVRYIMPGNGLPDLGPQEYFSYDSPTTGGHAIVAGCNGTAAYSVFRPSIPESFTSPGPATIYFDENNNRLIPPLVRQQPSIAAADGANTSFFAGDSGSDADTKPNFFGTSAAAPHAAAIAALVLQAHGGPGSVTPTQMRTLLQQSAFPHDLDPSTATGVATATNGGQVTVTIHSDNEANAGTGVNDPNSIAIGYVGPSFITGFTFNSNGLASEAGNVTGGENGLDAGNNYFSNVFAGVVFRPTSKAFTVGTSLPNSLGAGDVFAAPSNSAPSPSNVSDFWTLGLTFPNSNFTTGKFLRFTIGRGEQHASDDSTIDNPIGDIWGGGVLIPEGTTIPNGMRFSGTLNDGSTFTGRMINQIGSGYSRLDGFGFINAEAAVGMALQPPVQLTALASRKTHPGVAQPFEIDLPLTGTGVECRSGGAAGNYTLVFTFANPVTGVAGATVTAGTGLVNSRFIDNGRYVVNLTGVTNAQRVTVTLTGVIDNVNNSSASVSGTLPVLVADVNGDGFVDSADISQTKSQSGNTLMQSNFKADSNVDGSINSADISQAKARSGTGLP